MITTKHFTTLDARLLKAWEKLWKQSKNANFINNPFWLQAIIETFGYTTFVIIAVYDDDELLAVTGLVHTTQYGVAVYSIPPGDFVYGTPILCDFDDQKSMRALAKAMISLGTVVFDNVPPAFIEALRSATSKMTTTEYSINLFLDFTRDEKGVVQIPKRKRLLREAKEILPTITFESYGGASKELLDTAFRIDEHSRKHTRGYNAFSDQLTQSFYTSLARYFGTYLRLNFLYIEQTPVVYEMGFLIKETYHGSQIAFDERYKEFSPGKVFEVKLIEYVSAHGVNRVDYGSGDNFIKRTLASDSQKLYKVILSRNILTRFYLSGLYSGKDKIFAFLSNHTRIYTMYRTLRRLISL